MALVAMVRSGRAPDDVRAATLRALELLGGMARYVQPGQRVLVKPNFVAAVPSAVTDFDVVSTVIGEVRRAGAEPFLGECPGFEFDSAATLRFLKVDKFAEEHAIDLINLEKDSYVEVPFEHRRVNSVRVAQCAIDADAIINMPRMKSHKLTTVSLAIKNCFGLIAKDSRRRIHAAGIHEGIAALYKLFQPALTVMDGLTVPASGAVYGERLDLGAIAASVDMLTLDIACSPLLGAAVKDVEHLSLAARDGHSPPAVIGDRISPVCISGLEDTSRRRLYRGMYRSLYAFDHTISRFGFPTIIPWFHNRFGIRPVVRWGKCNDCGECVRVCEVDAIDLTARRLDHGRCARLRCMACAEVCEPGAITAAQLYRSI